MADSSFIDISELGIDRGCYVTEPAFKKPCIHSAFDDYPLDDDYIRKDLQKQAFTLFETCCFGNGFFTLDNLIDYLSGNSNNDQFDYLLPHLPRYVDFSNGDPFDQVYLTMHWSKIQRVLCFKREHVEIYRSFVSLCYSKTVKRPVVFMIKDPDMKLEAQSLFSVDLNLKFPTEIMTLINKFNVTSSDISISSITSLLCKAVALYRCRGDIVAVSSIVIDLLLTWKVPMALAIQVWTQVSKPLQELLQIFSKKGLMAQSAPDIDVAFDFIKPLATIATCFVAVIGTSALPGQKQIDSVLHRLGNLGKAASGYRALSTNFQDVIDHIFDSIYLTIFGVPHKKESLEDYLNGLKLWYEGVEEMSNLETQNKLHVDYKVCRKIEQLYQQGQRYLKSMKEMGLSRAQMDPFHGFFRIIVKLYDRVVAQGARKSEPRTEPVIIHMFGKSGAGKSGLTYLLAQDLLVLEGLHEDVLDEVYFRNVEQEFWDGYTGHAVVVYDDWGQMRDSEAKPNPEFMEVIRTGNIAPWNLHMAHLEEKARTRFTSRAVILTSNERVFDVQSITHREALERRKDIVVEVVLKEEYKNAHGRLNTSKCTVPLEVDCYEFIHYVEGDNLQMKPVCHVENGVLVPTRHSYHDFVTYCQTNYVEKYQKSKKRLQYLQKRGKEMSKKRDALMEKLQAQMEGDELFAANKQLVLCEKQEKTIAAEAIAFPFVWLSVNDEVFNNGISTEDFYIDDELIAELKRLASDSEDYTDFQNRARIVCHEKGWNFSERFKRNEWTQGNLLKVYSSKIYFYAKKAAKNTTNYAINLFYAIRDEIVNFWGRVIQGDFYANLQLAYWGLLLFAGYMIDKSNKAEIKKIEEAAPEDCFVFNDGNSRVLTTRQHMDEWCRENEIKMDLPKANYECEMAKDTPVCFACYGTGHWADACPIDRGIKERRERYLANSESFQEKRPRPSHKVAEGAVNYDEQQRPKKKVVAESKLNYDDRRPKPKRMVAEDIDLRPHYAKPTAESKLNYDDRRPLTKKMIAEDIESQAIIDWNAKEVATTVIPRNMYLLYTWNEETQIWVPKVNAVFVKGRCMLIVAHAVPFLGSKILLRNQYNPAGIEVAFEDITFCQVKNKSGEEIDCSVMVMPKYVPIHRTILNHFVKISDLSVFNTTNGNLYVVRNDDGLIVRHQFAIQNVKAIDCETYTNTTKTGTNVWSIRRGYSYFAETQHGDCTGLLVASNGALCRKILGMHVAGGKTGYAVSQSITQELINEAIKDVPLQAQVYIDLARVGIIEGVEPRLPEGDFIPVGKISKPIGSQIKTSVRESPLYGKVKEPTTAPARLSPFKNDRGEVVDPMYQGLKKCGKPNKLIDMNLVKRCVKSVFNKYRQNVKPIYRRIYTHEESITGIEGEEFLAPINRRSSPGYPWAQDRQGTLGKTKWLGEGMDYDVTNKELKDAVDERIECAKRGIRIPALWIDTLKDERRPLNKVKEGKTRVFSAGAMDYILATRRYYLGFYGHIMENRIENGSAVGINPYSNEWHRLALKLQSKGSKVVAGDFSNFDGSLIAAVLYEINEHIKLWYREMFLDEETGDLKEGVTEAEVEETMLIYDVLFQDIASSLHITGDDVVMWTHSQPSGNSGTVIYNTIFNETMFRYVFVKITKMPLQHFDLYVYFISYGDDNAANISEIIIKIFNQVTITAAFAEIGLTYTDEAKTGEVVEYRNLRDIAFLKRKFKYDNIFKRYVAPLDLDTILEMTMWIKGDVDQHKHCADNVELAYHELALHGKEIFDKWSNKLDRLCNIYLDSPPALYDFLDYKELEMTKWC